MWHVSLMRNSVIIKQFYTKRIEYCPTDDDNTIFGFQDAIVEAAGSRGPSITLTLVIPGVLNINNCLAINNSRKD